MNTARLVPPLTLLVIVAAGAGCATNRAKVADDVANTLAADAATSADARRAAEIQRNAKTDVRLREAFNLGQLQATKAVHQAILNTQQTDAPGAAMQDDSLVPLTIPERKVDGVIVNQGVEYVRLPR